MAWPHWNELLNGDARGNSVHDILSWWATRWVRFNLMVGIVGFLTWGLILVAGSAAVRPGVDFEEPLAMIFGPPVYGILTNCCYLLGALLNAIGKSEKPNKKLFRAGLFFSLILTGLPGIWAIVAWASTLITGHNLD